MTEELYFTIGFKIAFILTSIYGILPLSLIIAKCKAFLFDERYEAFEITYWIPWIEVGCFDFAWDFWSSMGIGAALLFITFLGWIIVFPIAILLLVTIVPLYIARAIIRLNKRVKKLED
jgi:hypothetical protein